MNSGMFLLTMWQQAGQWQLVLAFLCGILVGVIYFKSLRWSIEHLNEGKHKLRMFAGAALLRIILFFGIMALVSQRNVAVILIYVISFFITKMVIMIIEKGRMLKDTTEENADD